jgi:hypothetical protein
MHVRRQHVGVGPAARKKILRRLRRDPRAGKALQVLRSRRQQHGVRDVSANPCRKCGSIERRTNGVCAPCQRARDRARYKDPKRREQLKAGIRKHYANSENVQRRREHDKRYQEPEFLKKRRARHQERLQNDREYRERCTAAHRRTKLGISPKEQHALFDSQHGRCASCGDEIDFVTGHLDHDHATGLVRGFLCRECNQALGLLRDSADLARRLADYIDRFETKLKEVG